jgi:hypothetical protein
MSALRKQEEPLTTADIANQQRAGRSGAMRSLTKPTSIPPIAVRRNPQ